MRDVDPGTLSFVVGYLMIVIGMLAYLFGGICDYLKKKLGCHHVFYLDDIKGRDDKGNVSWSCDKCRRVFVESYGIKILDNGQCMGYRKNNEQII